MEERTSESSLKERQELELLERVFLRLSMAESDEQLEQIVGRFLCPVIVKTTSTFRSVTDKVMEVLNHVSRRLKSRPRVLLPAGILLSQFSDPTSPAAVKNVALVYLKLGYHRLSPQDQADMLPALVAAMNQKSPQHNETLLQLFITGLVHFSTTGASPELLRSLLPPAQSSSACRQTMMDFLLYTLLLPYSIPDEPTNFSPPGLSQSLVAMVTGGQKIHGDSLEQMKLCIVRLLSSDEVCQSQEVVCHMIVATTDSRHKVADQGDRHMKQYTRSVDWDNPQLVSSLYKLFLGDSGSGRKRQRPNTAPPTSDTGTRSPGSLRLRQSVLRLLTRSHLATNTFPLAIQVVFEGLFGGTTNPKLRTQSLEFVLFIIANATESKLTVMAPLLLTALTKVVDQPQEDSRLRAIAYGCTSSIARKVPSLFKKDPKQLQKLFDVLREGSEGGEVVLAVQECVGAVASAYRGVSESTATIVEALMLENVNTKEYRARLAASFCARTVFPFSHVTSRYVSLLACGDSREEVREDGKKGIVPPEDDPTADYPQFTATLKYIFIRAKANLSNKQCYSVAAGQLPYPPSILSEMLRFLHRCLFLNAGCGNKIADLGREEVASLRTYLAKLYSSDENEKDSPFDQYLYLLKQSLSPAGDADLHKNAMMNLMQVVLAAPQPVAMEMTSDLKWIKGFTQSSRPETREATGRLLGYLCSLLPPDQYLSSMRTTLEDTQSLVYHVKHGAVISLGYITASRMTEREEVESMDTGAADTRLKLTVSAIEKLSTLLESSDAHLARSACSSIGVISRSAPLPLPSTASDDSDGLCVLSLVQALSKQMRRSKDVILQERCATALGFMSVGDPSFEHSDVVLEALFSLKEEKHTDVQFSVGEALACTAAGPLCDLADDPWSVRKSEGERKEVKEGGGGVMEKMLKLLLGKYASSPAPLVRRAACVWLLCVLKHAYKHTLLKSYLKQFQAAFINMLADSNDMVQEVASHGLGLVYDLSDSAHKEELVHLLVETLLEGRRTAQPISGDSQVVQGVELGKTPQGSSLSTYKELCSLASDLNQPDLVYKFMHLAKHHALWNSKKGAAFGVTSIAAQAKEQFAPYLPSLVPRLYRYKYDPIPRIQLAMSNIWNAVVPHSKKTVDKYLHQIMKDLLNNLNSNQWRNREASCLGLRDLLVSAMVEDVAGYLPELWECCLKVLDDIKETVRKAADLACKTLTKVTVRACDGTTSTKLGSKVIKGTLPVLLSTGMSSPASEVRATSLFTILKLAKNAGSHLKPHIAVLVPALLESLSSLEPQQLNMISLQLGGDSETQEMLDTLRVAATKSSPMMETANLCIPYVDAEVLTEFVPRLVDLLRTGVGLGTKVAAAQFVVSLAHHCRYDLTPHAGKLMGALLSGLGDRSASVRKSYGHSIGRLVKYAKDNSVTKLIERLKKLYFTKEDSSVQSAVAYTVNSMMIHSLDASMSAGSEIAPLIFLAMHATPSEEDPSSKAIIKLWEESWQELVPNSTTGVKLYLGELVDVIKTSLSAQSWSVKKQAGTALASLADKIGPNLDAVHLTVILQSLLDGLQGRVWEGKVSLLKAMKSVCKSCSAAVLAGHQPSSDEIVKALLVQCGKRDLRYKAVAIEVTGQVAAALDMDCFSELCDVVVAVLRPSEEEERGDDETEREEARVRRVTMAELQVKSIEALGEAWPTNELSQGRVFPRLITLLSEVLHNNTRKMQVAVLNTLTAVFTRFKIKLPEEDLSVCSGLVPGLTQCLGNRSYSSVRKSAVEATDQLVQLLLKLGSLTGSEPNLLADIRVALQEVTDDQLRELVQKKTLMQLLCPK